MKPTLPVAAAILVGGFFLGRVSSAGDDADKTVAAEKYRVSFVQSALDWTHGGGVPVHALFLPDAKVAAYLEYRSELRADGHYRERPMLHAYAAEKADGAIPEKAGESPKIEHLRIPQDLARQLEEYAALTKKLRDEGFRIGSELRSRLGLEPIPNRNQ